MLQVKVCGITRAEDALLAAELGASAVGFIFWPGSPRFIDPYRARKVAAVLPAFVTVVGVFVDQPLEYVRGVAGVVRLGAVQLHGEESAEYCRAVGYRVVKTVALSPAGPVPCLEAMAPETTVLLDAHDPIRKGGTGTPIDWAQAAGIARSRPVFLSGGLRAHNVGRAVEMVRPYGVDVSSGVESEPGKKDATLVKAFFEAVARAGGRDREGGAQVSP